MTKVLSAVLVVLACALPVRATSTVPKQSRSDLELTMVNECGASRVLIQTAEREAARVWAGHVTLHGLLPSRISYAGLRSNWLVVRCIGGGPPALESSARSSAAFATIRFIGLEPTNTIAASLGNARALLGRDTPSLRDIDQREMGGPLANGT